jgi:hypothetical protein
VDLAVYGDAGFDNGSVSEIFWYGTRRMTVRERFDAFGVGGLAARRRLTACPTEFDGGRQNRR